MQPQRPPLSRMKKQPSDQVGEVDSGRGEKDSERIEETPLADPSRSSTCCGIDFVDLFGRKRLSLIKQPTRDSLAANDVHALCQAFDFEFISHYDNQGLSDDLVTARSREELRRTLTFGP